MATVVLGGTRIDYHEAGAGEPVVLVHGLGQDSVSWLPQLTALTGVHLYAPDVRGHGRSGLGAVDGTLAQLADDLSEFLATVSGPATCVGFSMGGTIALAAALTRPELVPRLVVLGTSSVVGRAAADYYRRRAAEATDPTALAAGVREDIVAALHVRPDQPTLDALVADRLRAIGDGRGFSNAARALAAVAAEPLTARLPALRCPVTVIGAEHDALCPRRAADILLAGLPNARYVEISGVGHLMNVEQPDAVTSAVRDAVTA